MNLFDVEIWAPVVAILTAYSIGAIILVCILVFILRGRIKRSYVSSILLIIIALFILIATIYLQVIESDR
jgi:hypothetical protein